MTGKQQRWAMRSLTVVVAFLALVLAIFYGGSAYVMRRDIPAPLPTITPVQSPADILEGARLARLAGCTRCHGDQAQGQILSNVSGLREIIAPSLPRIAARATDGQIARAIRNGVGVDARPLFAMPVGAFNGLADADVARLIAWIRTLPTSAFDVVGFSGVGMQERFAILTGNVRNEVVLDEGQPVRRPENAGGYFATLTCGQCHALKAGDAGAHGQDAQAPLLAGWRAPANAETMARLVSGHAEHAALAELTPGEWQAIGAFLARN